MLKNLTIKTRLTLMLAFLAGELIFGAAVGIYNLGAANDAMKTMYEDHVVAMGELDTVVRLLNVNQLDVARALTAGPAQVARLMDDVEENMARVSTTWERFAATVDTPEARRLAGQFAEARRAFVGQALAPAVAALRAGQRERAVALVQGPMVSRFEPVRASVNALLRMQKDGARARYEHGQRVYTAVRAICLGGLGFGLVLAGVLGALLVRGIVRPLEEAVQVAAAVAGGDLTRRIEVRSRDETGRLMQALKDMNDALARIVSQVRGGTDGIATASGQIAAGNLDLSARTERQAGSLEETAASIEELTSTVRQNAENARQANALALSASEVAQEGGAVVARVVRTMGAINQSSARIADIIGVIDSIAFQTNILALNAAVEAARAGEQGRGFAVVASEVRGLAQRSAAAAREIKALIDDSVQEVRHGSELVDQAGSTMATIVQGVARVTAIMGEITTASLEQAAGIEQVNLAVGQMDQVTQQNAALVEQASAAAQALREEADALARTVGAFRLAALRPAALA
jgi:methyl-accepting chemotaxis protein-1 (serine sensor receptor)